MTSRTVHIKKAEPPRLGALCLALLLFFSLALMLRRADIATDSMRKGLALCARAIVPSLFPFMVLSELLVATGAGEYLTAPLVGKTSRTFARGMLCNRTRTLVWFPRRGKMRDSFPRKRNYGARRVRARASLLVHSIVGIPHQHRWNDILEERQVWNVSLLLHRFGGTFERSLAIRTAKTKER